MKKWLLVSVTALVLCSTQAWGTEPDCLSGLPEDISMSELTLLKFNFGARTMPAGQRCAADMVIPYDSSNPSSRPTIRCQVCMEVSYNDPRSIGVREVARIQPNELGDVRFYFKEKTDVTTAMKLSCKTEGTSRGLAQLFQTPGSAKSFLNRMKETLNITCTQPPIPPEAQLRPGDGGAGQKARVQ